MCDKEDSYHFPATKLYGQNLSTIFQEDRNEESPIALEFSLFSSERNGELIKDAPASSDNDSSSSDEHSTSSGTTTLYNQSENDVVAQVQDVTLSDESTGLAHSPKTSFVQKIFIKLHLSSSSNSSSNTPPAQHGGKDVRYLGYYGQLLHKKLGEGVSGTVQLVQRQSEIHAVKIFRKNRRRGNKAAYMKLLAGEFCIASVLDHENIVRTFDFVQLDEHHDRHCIVMEYCPDGDMYSLIKSGKMTTAEVYSYFKQLLHGLEYLHNLGVAHRDLKPENLLLKDGKLKIADFGAADVFRVAWQDHSRLSDGLCGTTPYMAPEIFVGEGYWAAPVDVWAAGIVFFCMMLDGVPFGSAVKTDSNYPIYVRKRQARQYVPFDKFDPEPRELIYAMLHPNPRRRITAQEILNTRWMRNVY